MMDTIGFAGNATKVRALEMAISAFAGQDRPAYEYVQYAKAFEGYLAGMDQGIAADATQRQQGVTIGPGALQRQQAFP